MGNEEGGFFPKLLDRVLTWGVKPMLSGQQIKEIIDDQLNPPHVIDPQEFLARPKGVEIGRLPFTPDIKLLRWLPTLDNEVGLVFQKSNWYIIKSIGLTVPTWPLSEESDIRIHSHPAPQSGGGQDDEHDFVPSHPDLLNCSALGKEFIVSREGITQYWPIQDAEGRQALKQGLERHKPGNLQPTAEEHLDLLKRVNARYNLNSWEDLSEEKLRDILNS